MSDRHAAIRRPIPLGGGLVTYTGTASVAVTAPSNATAVLVHVTSLAYVSCNKAASVATTADMPLVPSVPIYLDCEPGDKLSAIQVAAGGTIYYCWMT